MVTHKRIDANGAEQLIDDFLLVIGTPDTQTRQRGKEGDCQKLTITSFCLITQTACCSEGR